MTEFTFHDKDSAPETARPILEQAEQAFGFVPNLLRGMAESPALVEAYFTMSGIMDKTSLTPAERQIVLLTVSRYNECQYCVSAHSMLADMSDVPAEATEAIRSDQPIADARLEALRRFTEQVVDKRGWVSDEDIQAFLAAGYDRAQLADVIVGVGMKTLSNYFNHIAGTPLDDAFASREWSPTRKAG